MPRVLWVLQVRLLLSGLLAVSVAGCGGTGDGEPEASPGSPHGGVHEEEEHLEHHIPEHRPPDFSSAVEQIELRFTELANSSQGSLPETQLHELADIIRWLPEIAADSDMRRQHWEQADRLAEELAAELEQWARLPAAERAGVPSAIEQTLKSLTELKGTELKEDQRSSTNG